jgi:hypothetical protein
MKARSAATESTLPTLIVSSRSLEEGPLEISAADPPRELRPYGGVVCTGKPGAMEVVRRGALAKTGSWTHQYSDLGNTSCSTDEVVQGELHALWFRDVDLEMPQRHGRGHAPLFHEGRMFVEGVDALRAVDAYNGRNLWEFPLPGIPRRSAPTISRAPRSPAAISASPGTAFTCTTRSAAIASTRPRARSWASSPPRLAKTAGRRCGATSPATASACTARSPTRSIRSASRTCGPT